VIGDEELLRYMTIIFSEITDGINGIKSMTKEEKAMLLFSILEELSKSAKNRWSANGSGSSGSYGYKSDEKNQNQQNIIVPEWIVLLLYPFYSFVSPNEKEQWLKKSFYTLKNKNLITNTDEEITKFIKEFQTNKNLFKDIVGNTLSKYKFSKHSKQDFEKESKEKSPLSKLKNFLTNLINKKNNPLVKVIARVLLAMESIVVETPLYLYDLVKENIIKPILGGKSSRTPGREDVSGLEQGIDDLGQGADDIKKDEKDQDKSKEEIGEDIKEGGAGTVEVTPIIEPTSPEELSATIEPSDDTDNSMEGDRNAIHEQGQKGEGTGENPNISATEAEDQNTEGRNEAEEVEESGELKVNGEAKVDGVDGESEEEAREMGDPSITPEDNTQTNSETQDIEDNNILNEQLNDNNDVLPDLKIFDETALKSGGDRDESTEKAKKDSAAPTNEKHTFLGSLERATGTVEIIEQEKKEEDKKTSTSQSLGIQ
jgi:hypothetical protein